MKLPEKRVLTTLVPNGFPLLNGHEPGNGALLLEIRAVSLLETNLQFQGHFSFILPYDRSTLPNQSVVR